MRRAGALRHQKFHRPSDQLFAAVSEKFLNHQIQQHDSPLPIDFNDGVRRRFEQLPESPFGAHHAA
jgi:hypothetical protein